MISPITASPNINSSKNRTLRKNLVSNSGYAATACGVLCAVTGMKNLKFKHKMKIHKISAALAGIFTILHISVIKGFGKKFINSKS